MNCKGSFDINRLELFSKEYNINLTDSYNYVTDLTFKQLNKTNLDKLNDKIKEINNKIKELNNSTKKDLWLNDLKLL
jgi:uncharacterized protein YpuA (DUF1002 family)